MIALFKASLTADNSQHRSIQQQLSGFNSVPDFNAYLAYILNQSQEDGAIRQLAGLTLKNNIKDNWHELSPSVQEHVRESLLGSLGDPHKYIRATVGSCITTVICALAAAKHSHNSICTCHMLLTPLTSRPLADIGDLEAWPALIPALVDMLDSQNDSLVDGALSAFHKICEVRTGSRRLSPLG